MPTPAEYPEPLEALIGHLKQLPGVGRRSAERMALALLKLQPEKLRDFGNAIANLPIAVSWCPQCGNITIGDAPCRICASPHRDAAVICVVEDFTRIAGIEKSGGFRGLYHVLGGRLSPLDDAGEDQLHIESLERRLADGTVREVIIALSGDVEGRATALYLARRLSGQVEKITQLAQGLPAGGDLAYADSATILAALSGRRAL